MGLCKCPKRQVTTQFCFEHRVNVCENCMVTSHPKCVVQSYIQWLKDSDYVSTCLLCDNSLENEDCVRLICYHVFHWNCLNGRQESLPPTTAPGGHTCPACDHPIFPPTNMISPVADILRGRLSQVNWGRNELGLPLLSEQRIESRNQSQNYETNIPPSVKSVNQKSNAVGYHNGASINHTVSPPSNTHSVLHIDNGEFSASSRRALLAREPPIGGSDRDDNKYKKRTPVEIFSRWSRRFYAPSSRPPWRRTWVLVVCGILFFCIVIYLMATIGRSVAENDPSLDSDNNLLFNPNHDV